MLQPLPMLLITFAFHKHAPLQGYTLNPACIVRFSFFQNILTIIHYTLPMQVLQSLLLVI